MSEAIYTLDAEIRSNVGKGASRRLRHSNLVPAIVYGENSEPLAIAIEHRHILKSQESESFYSHILTLNVAGGETISCILKDMQRHPYKPIVMHMDFLRISSDHKLQTIVPIHYLNENVNEAIKAGGILNHLVNDIEITCLPKDLPEFIEVDVKDLEMGTSLHLSNVILPAGVSSVELAKGEGHDLAIANIHKPRGASADEEAEAAAE